MPVTARWLVGCLRLRTMLYRRTLLVLCCVAASGGCRSLSREGPVPRSVANCRQFSQQGINAMERGDWPCAESLLTQALKLCPTDSDARRNYAETLWHRGAKEAAVEQMEQARKVAIEDASLAVRCGEMYLAMDQVERARQAAEQALDLDPKFALAWALRGRVLERRGQPQQALADYQRALGFAPNNTEVMVRIAETYHNLGMPTRSLAALQNVIDTYPPGSEPANLLYLQGLALTALGRYNDAVESLAAASHREAPTAELLCRLAEAHLLAGRPNDARTEINQALLLEPQHQASLALARRMQLPVAQVATRPSGPVPAAANSAAINPANFSPAAAPAGADSTALTPTATRLR